MWKKVGGKAEPMLTIKELAQLALMQGICFALTGQKIDLVAPCEHWLASGDPALVALARFLAGGSENALPVLDDALAQEQLGLSAPLLHGMRALMYEFERRPAEAYAEYSTALQDMPEGGDRDTLLAHRRRVAYIAN